MHYPRGIQLHVLNGTARQLPNQVEARLVGPVRSFLFGRFFLDQNPDAGAHANPALLGKPKVLHPFSTGVGASFLSDVGRTP